MHLHTGVLLRETSSTLNILMRGQRRFQGFPPPPPPPHLFPIVSDHRGCEHCILLFLHGKWPPLAESWWKGVVPNNDYLYCKVDSSGQMFVHLQSLHCSSENLMMQQRNLDFLRKYRNHHKSWHTHSCQSTIHPHQQVW